MATLPSPQEIQTEARTFRGGFKTVLLATVTPEGRPEASYAPCVLDATESVCVFISELAQHTKNLLANPRASLLFIANEGDSRNLFARQRLVLECVAREIPTESSAWSTVMAEFEAGFDKTIAVLKALPDFHLFRLEVKAGNYVRGFGQAFEVADASLVIIRQRRG